VNMNADFSLEISTGDRLLLFTDGVTEAANQKEVEFGYEGITNAAGTASSSAVELKGRIMKEVADLCYGEFRDDVTLIVACIR
jgi:sigma-B regulation protein RsbU (phosphoserine phosphatase)